MKKYSLFLKTNSESGFVLPYVLMIVTFTLILMTANINIYQQEVELTKSYLEHTKIDTLLKLGYDSFLKEHGLNHATQERIIYEFRLGTVDVTFRHKADELSKLYFVVNTNQGTRYTLLKHVNVTED